jgi:drug/metabolite transporter (DMT)-like permease
VANEKQSNHIFIWGMVLSMTCWGFSWTSGKILAAYGDAVTISFIRFFITFISLLLLLFFLKDKFTIKRTGLADLLIASAMLTIYTWLFFKGLQLGKAGAGGVLVTVLNPIFAYGITIGLAKRKPTGNETLGLALGLIAGIVLLRIFDNPANVFSAGNIFFLLAAVVWAILSRFTARAGKYGSSVTFSFWLYGLSSMVLFVLTGFSTTASIVKSGDSVFWWNLIFSATITTSLATTFYFIATARVGASRASSFIFLVPFSAALGSWLFLDEKIEIHTVIGGLLGIAAVYILNKKNTKPS